MSLENCCPECGSPLTPRPEKTLLAYLEQQHRGVTKTYKTRLRINPEMSEETKARYMKNIDKWEGWVAWLATQLCSATPPTKEGKNSD